MLKRIVLCVGGFVAVWILFAEFLISTQTASQRADECVKRWEQQYADQGYKTALVAAAMNCSAELDAAKEEEKKAKP